MIFLPLGAPPQDLEDDGIDEVDQPTPRLPLRSKKRRFVRDHFAIFDRYCGSEPDIVSWGIAIEGKFLREGWRRNFQGHEWVDEIRGIPPLQFRS